MGLELNRIECLSFCLFGLEICSTSLTGEVEKQFCFWSFYAFVRERRVDVVR